MEFVLVAAALVVGLVIGFVVRRVVMPLDFADRLTDRVDGDRAHQLALAVMAAVPEVDRSFPNDMAALDSLAERLPSDLRPRAVASLDDVDDCTGLFIAPGDTSRELVIATGTTPDSMSFLRLRSDGSTHGGTRGLLRFGRAGEQ